MIIIHTLQGDVYVLELEEGGVEIYVQESNELLAYGEHVQIGYGYINCIVKEKRVWSAGLMPPSED